MPQESRRGHTTERIRSSPDAFSEDARRDADNFVPGIVPVGRNTADNSLATVINILSLGSSCLRPARFPVSCRASQIKWSGAERSGKEVSCLENELRALRSACARLRAETARRSSTKILRKDEGPSAISCPLPSAAISKFPRSNLA